MEKFSYNSYPDSTESSPRSREIDFDNPPPWEDQQQQQTYKVKFMCSYGGKIQPRPHDNQLTYVNGDTKIMSVDRSIKFPSLVSKLSTVCGGGDGAGGEISFKYQLPGEDLDALISVTNDDDLEHMMHEYDRLLRLSTKPARLRLFLFPSSSSVSGGFGSEEASAPNRPESEKSLTAPTSNADFLFGSEKLAPALPPPAQDPAAVEQPVFVNHHVIQPDNPVEIQRQIHEFQRIQIRDQEQQLQQQQEEAMYRRKSEDGGGIYFPPTTNQQPPVGYWQGNNNNNIYTTTSPSPLPNLQVQEQQQVYMIPNQSQAPGTLYHSVMRPTTTAQGNQGYYNQPVQHHPDAYMAQQNYNVVQPPQQPTYSSGPQVMTSVGGPMGNHVYYTVAGDGMMVHSQPQATQPQYQGMVQPISGMTELRTGPDGKVVATAPRMSQNSDSV